LVGLSVGSITQKKLRKNFPEIFRKRIGLTTKKNNRVNSDGNQVQGFLSRVSILTRDIDIANLSVRLSVRPLPSGIR